MDVKSELEDLCGILIAGDITPVVARMLKDTRYKKDLIEYLGGKVNTIEVEEPVKVSSSPSLAELFNNSIELL